MPMVWSAVGAVMLPNVGGWLGSICVRQNYETWYLGLKKPSWTPPSYVFGPVWTALYSSMGYASYLVWKEGGGFGGEAKLPLILYATQLGLNWLWTPVFFGAHSIKGGLVNILALSVSVACCAVKFNSISQTAGLLMVPYIAWLGLATSLNYSIYRKNPDNNQDKTQ